MENGVWLSPTGAFREHHLPYEVDRWRAASYPSCGRAGDGGVARVQCPESDVRARPASFRADSEMSTLGRGDSSRSASCATTP